MYLVFRNCLKNDRIHKDAGNQELTLTVVLVAITGAGPLFEFLVNTADAKLWRSRPSPSTGRTLQLPSGLGCALLWFLGWWPTPGRSKDSMVDVGV